MLRQDPEKLEQKQPTPHTLKLFSPPSPTSRLAAAILTNPDQFIAELAKQPAPLSRETARRLDQLDPLAYTAEEFKMSDIIPFAGHSLGPLFKPMVTETLKTFELQASQLHSGHFKNSHPDGKQNAHWFECDRETSSLQVVKQLMGIKEDCEFIFTANGLSDNLAKIMNTLYDPSFDEWEAGKTKIAMLDGEFFSDQAVINSVIRTKISSAKRHKCFTAGRFNNVIPAVADQILKIRSDENGLYQTDQLISTIKAHAKEIQMLCLSDIVFSTGQRLDLHRILSVLKETIEKNHIIVGLDLAHSIGNRPIDLENMPVQISFAVGCAYKHFTGPAGSGFGFYVNRHVDLEEHPSLQGWKSANPDRVFGVINQFDDSIMAHTGAAAFRISNPPPVALHPAQTYLRYFDKVGFDKCFNKSEALTRYLIMQLKHHLSDKIEIITPEDPKQRGATIVFRVKDATNLHEIERQLKEVDSDLGKFEIDTRPPNNIRLTAHYGYTKFEHICRLASKLELILDNKLENRQEERGAVSYYGV